MRPDAPFDDFWAVYPRRDKKLDAHMAWDRAIALGHEPAAVIAGAKRYREEIARDGTPKRFVALPATWIRGERWTDEDELNLPATGEAAIALTTPADVVAVLSLNPKFTRAVIQRWIDPCSVDLAAGRIEAPTVFFAGWLEANLRDALSSVLGREPAIVVKARGAA